MGLKVEKFSILQTTTKKEKSSRRRDILRVWNIFIAIAQIKFVFPPEDYEGREWVYATFLRKKSNRCQYIGIGLNRREKGMVFYNA